MAAVTYDVVARDARTNARAGVLRTTHGEIPTPAFAPVGTQGAVKAMSPRNLTDVGVDVVMANAYHLEMRPGADVVAGLGGLHGMSGWDGPLMTDSGGFQVFSLESRRDIDDDGVTFRSHIDGAVHRFSPESVVALQEALGADLIMPLDVCTGYPVTRDKAAEEASLTHEWAQRALAAHKRDDQLLYGIVQGSVYGDLRRESAAAVAALGFPGFAIGGVSVGEPKVDMLLAVEASVPQLPETAPRHLLGVGHPEDIVAAVARGIDTFDCVAPTRWARNAGALTMSGRVNMRNAEHARDPRPLQLDCDCYTCRHFSRGAIRHFVKSGEILGLHLLTVHNLHFILNLTRRLRSAILDGTFGDCRDDFLDRYADGAFAESPSSA